MCICVYKHVYIICIILILVLVINDIFDDNIEYQYYCVPFILCFLYIRNFCK